MYTMFILRWITKYEEEEQESEDAYQDKIEWCFKILEHPQFI